MTDYEHTLKEAFKAGMEAVAIYEDQVDDDKVEAAFQEWATRQNPQP